MNPLLYSVAAMTAVLRSALLAGGIVLAAVALGDWAVRTRRISPFHGLSRFMRSQVDPRLMGIERTVMRMGGHPTATPWWALVFYGLAAAVFLAAIDMVVQMVAQATFALNAGGTGILSLLVHWTFAFLRMALLVRVFSSWFPSMARSRWVTWSFGATEWIIGPLRRVIPAFGMIDITPIVAYFILSFVEGLL